VSLQVQMKKLPVFLATILALRLFTSCNEKWLDIEPGGIMDESILANSKGIDALLVGAYSMLDGVSAEYGWESASSNWLYGSIRGLEANKGTDSGMESTDLFGITNYTDSSTNSYLSVKWREVYTAIARCNSVIYVTNKALEKGNINDQEADLFTKQARALRGWYHFEAWRMWKMIPYVTSAIYDTVNNKTDVRPKIIEDLTEGSKLPDKMGQVGRFNGTVSKVLLAKALMQMDQGWTEALSLLNSAKNGTKPNGDPIGLASTFGEIFDIPNRNGIEAVYTVQTSVNDGSGGINGGYGEVLNFPYKAVGSPGGCCGFFQPIQEFVNSFRTSGGLPLLDNSYNLQPVVNDEGIPATNEWSGTKDYQKDEIVTIISADQHHDTYYKSLTYQNTGHYPPSSPADWVQFTTWNEDQGSLDPRLDWTVGRKGIPYWDWGINTGKDWVRDQSYAGPYTQKKAVYKKADEGKLTETGGWTKGWTANGYRMIRYADILLMIAECQIETGDLSGALANINLVRNRAANPDGFVKEADGITPAANYQIKPYPSFPDKDYARKALRMERKLELGMEGHRFFDLNRWDITVTELNRILDYEKTMPWGRSHYGNVTVGPEDVWYPIPQHEIDLSMGRLVQNR
jgi:starch-binding outer membrane protein, SusD/RagB family